MKPKVLVTQWIPDEINKTFGDKISLIYPSKEKISYTDEEIEEMLPDCCGLFTIFNKANKERIDLAKNLKVIANLGVGYDAIDVEHATSKNIAVINTPSAVTEGTAELTISLLVSSMRNIVGYDRKVREGKWVDSAFEDEATEIFGHSLGIAGFGRIGKSVCRKAQAMGLKVFYYDPYKLSSEDEKEFDVEYLNLDDLFAKCDCISLHMPYTPENHHLVDEKRFATMKKGSFIINAARGPIIKESALVKALNDGTLKGAGLDVFEFEPNISQELKECKNVVLSPHVGTQTYQIRIDMCHEALNGMIEILNGNQPYNLVNTGISI